MKPLYLAPMAELSHRALRELIEEFGGCDLYYTEMISAGGLVSGGPYEAYYLDAGPDPSRCVHQLCGGDAGVICKAVELLEATDAFGIDINMGCSAPAITRAGAGAAWLKDAEAAARLIAAARAVTKKRLSVKLRIGPEDDFERLVSFCRGLADAGAEHITLHPRTSKEKFTRRARKHYVSALSAALNVPVSGNGDIDGVRACLNYMDETECAAVMLGRFAVQNPRVFAELKGLQTGAGGLNFFDTAMRFIELLETYGPPDFFESRARRFFFYYCKNLTWGTWVYNRIARESSPGGLRAALRAALKIVDDSN